MVELPDLLGIGRGTRRPLLQVWRGADGAHGRRPCAERGRARSLGDHIHTAAAVMSRQTATRTTIGLGQRSVRSMRWFATALMSSILHISQALPGYAGPAPQLELVRSKVRGCSNYPQASRMPK